MSIREKTIYSYKVLGLGFLSAWLSGIAARSVADKEFCFCFYSVSQ